MKKISLEELVGGSLQEQFAKAFDKVVGNLYDPNTSFREVRKIVIELKFTQNEARDDVSCAVSVREKLAAQAPIQTAFVVGKDLKTGEMFAEEYGKHKHPKGQMTIEETLVDPDTGEVLEETPKANGNIVDLRRVANK